MRCKPRLPKATSSPRPARAAVPARPAKRPPPSPTSRRRYATCAITTPSCRATRKKIISNGTSAGGALSVLLGASGNHADYATALQALGAADARDDIYAVSAYCPISILEHADAAYEWEFNGVNDYEKMDISMLDYKVERKLVKGTLDAAEQRVSDELKAQFPAYVNSLGLKTRAAKR